MTEEDRMHLFWCGIGLFAALAIAIYAFPYIVCYLLPTAALAALFGFVWLRLCYVSDIERQYQRVAFLIPLSLAIIGIALLLLKLEVDQVVFESARIIGKHSDEQRQVTRTFDQWNVWFLGFYNAWYGNLPLAGKTLDVGFSYRHLWWIAAAGMLLGAPGVFYWFSRVDAKKMQEKREKWIQNLQQECNNSVYEMQRETNKQRAELKKREEQLSYSVRQAIEKKDKEIESRDRQIENLKLREKYLTEGKPKKFIDTHENPDLDFL